MKQRFLQYLEAVVAEAGALSLGGEDVRGGVNKVSHTFFRAHTLFHTSGKTLPRHFSNLNERAADRVVDGRPEVRADRAG